MTTLIVVDASVALKWVVCQAGSEEAARPTSLPVRSLVSRAKAPGCAGPAVTREVG